MKPKAQYNTTSEREIAPFQGFSARSRHFEGAGWSERPTKEGIERTSLGKSAELTLGPTLSKFGSVYVA